MKKYFFQKSTSLCLKKNLKNKLLERTFLCNPYIAVSLKKFLWNNYIPVSLKIHSFKNPRFGFLKIHVMWVLKKIVLVLRKYSLKNTIVCHWENIPSKNQPFYAFCKIFLLKIHVSKCEQICIFPGPWQIIPWKNLPFCVLEKIFQVSRSSGSLTKYYF